MTPARRCESCKTDWPTTVVIPDEFDEMSGERKCRPAYTVCPECQKATTYKLDGDPIPDEEVDSRRKHAEFEAYFKDWDERRIEREVAGAMADLEREAA